MLGFIANGADKVLGRLDRGSNLTRDVLPDAMKDAVLYTISQTPGYPSPPAGSRYQRTGTLGRSLTGLQGSAPMALSRVEPHGSVVEGYYGTNVTYGPFVVDEKRQAKVHQGRWFTLQGVVQKARPGIVRILKQSIIKRLSE